MKYKFLALPVLNSITGLSATAAASMFVAKKFNWAAFIFGALSLGSAGVAWDRYSTKSGASLDVRVFKKGRKPDNDEIQFILTHLPYVFLAIFSFLVDRKLRRS